MLLINTCRAHQAGFWDYLSHVARLFPYTLYIRVQYNGPGPQYASLANQTEYCSVIYVDQITCSLYGYNLYD